MPGREADALRPRLYPYTCTEGVALCEIGVRFPTTAML